MATVTIGSTTYGLVTLPSSPPAPANVEWSYNDNVGINESPFAWTTQSYDWQQSKLAAKVTYPNLSQAQARAWEAFLMACRGRLNVFLFGDSVETAAAGSGGTFAVGAGGQTGYSLSTTASGNVVAGDWISIGTSPALRLYKVTSVSGGNLGIWPPLRESPAGGATITTVNPQGLFRLSKNQRSIQQKLKSYHFVMDIEEVPPS